MGDIAEISRVGEEKIPTSARRVHRRAVLLEEKKKGGQALSKNKILDNSHSSIHPCM